MANVLIIEDPKTADPVIMDGIFRLRHKVFSETLRWVAPTEGGLEIDAYDHLPPVHVAIVDNARRVLGCLRMVPTDGPNMLRDIFPVLMQGQPVPASPQVWEISRFAVQDDPAEYLATSVSLITNRMLQAIFSYARAKEIKALLGVTDLSFERLLRRAGMYTVRYSPPRRIGVCTAVAGYADVTDALIENLRLRGVEIQRSLAASLQTPILEERAA